MIRDRSERRALVLACFSTALLIASCVGGSALFAAEIPLSHGQTLYVPVYSYIYYGDKAKKIGLTATLTIRNTDPSRSIEVASVSYHDSDGKAIRQYLKDPVELGPLASTHFLVAESDLSGGLGASFVIKWKSGQAVSEPIVESVMIGTLSAQGISFVCRGQPIRN